MTLEDATDIAIWNYAKLNNYAIVTYDSDFYDIANLKGHPPKIIWLRLGNTSTANLASVFLDKFETIESFLSHPDNDTLACLEIE